MFSCKVKGGNGQQGRNSDDRETPCRCHLKKPSNSANELMGEGGLACDQVYASILAVLRTSGPTALLDPRSGKYVFIIQSQLPQTRSKNIERRNADPPHSRLHQVHAWQVGNVRIFIAQLDQLRTERKRPKDRR
jgi:hypothetical protein